MISLVKDFLYQVNTVFTNQKTLILCIAVNIENFRGEDSLKICLGRQLFFFLFFFFPGKEGGGLGVPVGGLCEQRNENKNELCQPTVLGMLLNSHNLARQILLFPFFKGVY